MLVHGLGAWLSCKGALPALVQQRTHTNLTNLGVNMETTNGISALLLEVVSK
jgi:hypothetical protein